ncbi:MAG TPA: chromosomal replication initiator protein DnaA [Candidatus Faeciplasma pullistercoris]|uniref:Chromosomal replication initiator protein DnaA n=1 Tax=Candidatus Faeciplasma pullistercoris TaxID=2840800 RepID=A0A9D1GRX5_9FIRM|nr:chromosomal replication initiator protein DnaA [Candidatus Faeciplasma pullistercoris]
MNSFYELFDSVKRACQLDPKVSEIGYNRWIKCIEPGRLDGKKVTLIAPSDFTRRTTQDIYGDVFARALEHVLGFPVEVEFVVKDGAKNDATGFSEYEKKMNELINSHRRSEYELTFENFIKGKSNELAYAYCIAVSGKNSVSSHQLNKSMFNPLFIYGDSGLGKTHLLRAIEHEVKKNNPDLKVIYTTGESFTNELVKAVSEKTTTEFHEKYRNCDFLLVDDIQFIAGKEMTQEEFFHTFNALYNVGKQIVLTSDISPNRIRQLEDRIKNRFIFGVQADVQPPDFETRLAIVKRKAELLDLNIPDNVARLLSERIKKNIRQLEGAVNKMKGLTMFSNETPSISMAQRVIKETLIDAQPAEITIDRILNDVSASFNVTPQDIKSANRNAQISLARKVAVYIIREVKGMSFTDIGKEFNRNHSTMTISYADIKDTLSHNADLRETIEDIIKNLKSI